MKATRVIQALDYLWYVIAVAIVGFGLVACTTNQNIDSDYPIVSVDLSHVKTIDLSTYEIIKLETNPQTVCADINSIVLKDDTIVVHSRNSLMRFDNKGRFLGSVGDVGRAKDEYLEARNIFEKDDHLFVFDWQGQKMNEYTFSGDFVKTYKVETTHDNIYPSTILPLNDGSYLATNSYQGEDEITPFCSKLSNKFSIESFLCGKNVRDGMTHNDIVISPNGYALMAEAFQDTIYRIDANENKIEIAYYVDFGEYKITEDEKNGKSYVEMIQYTNSPDVAAKKAALIWHNYETEENLMFMFAFHSTPHIAVYNRNSHESKVYSLYDSTGRYSPTLFASYQDDALYCTCIDSKIMGTNPVIIKIPYSRFMP